MSTLPTTFSLTTYQQAIDAGEFEFFYQPIVNDRNQVVSFEALMRWTHDGEVISPVVFIKDLEDYALLFTLTERLMCDAGQAYLKLVKRFPALQYVAINIEPHQLLRPEFFDVLKELDANAATSLAFEVVENMPMPEKEQVEGQIQRLKGLGIGLHLDDIGQGYSTIENLCSYAFELGKIDRQILMDTMDSGEVKPLIDFMRSIYQTGHRVVIEGVETSEQLAFVRGLSAQLSIPVDIQGFYFSRPQALSYWLDEQQVFERFS